MDKRVKQRLGGGLFLLGGLIAFAMGYSKVTCAEATCHGHTMQPDDQCVVLYSDGHTATFSPEEQLQRQRGSGFDDELVGGIAMLIGVSIRDDAFARAPPAQQHVDLAPRNPRSTAASSTAAASVASSAARRLITAACEGRLGYGIVVTDPGPAERSTDSSVSAVFVGLYLDAPTAWQPE
jgi:hypothetical protein